MVVLSVLWCLCSLPILTLGASSAALYHTAVKVIRQNRGYAFANFRDSFKGSLRQTFPFTVPVSYTHLHCITWSPDKKDMFIIYHRHYDLTKMSPRRLCVDRIRFEEQDNGPDILVVDGPVTTPQPCFFQA